MHNKLPSGILVILVVFCTSVQALPIQWNGNGHTYQPVAVAQDISWSQASAAAATAGGYLVTITSPEENAFVFSIIQNDDSMWHPVGSIHGPWIGAFQPPGSQEPAGGFQWVTDEPFGYSNWRPGEPNNAGGDEHFAHFIGSGGARSPLWNDLPDVGAPSGGVTAYVIEFTPIPEPATWLLLVTGSLASIGYGWHKRRQATKTGLDSHYE